MTPDPRRIDPSVSRRMRAVARVDTLAEKKLQASLRAIRLRFATHQDVERCRPDIIFRSQRLLVFVDGDFWHGRLLVEGGGRALRNSFQKHAVPFWVAKITRNVLRDQRQVSRLRRHGWSVMRLWERDVLNDPDAAASLVSKRLRALQRRPQT